MFKGQEKISVMSMSLFLTPSLSPSLSSIQSCLVLSCLVLSCLFLSYRYSDFPEGDVKFDFVQFKVFVFVVFLESFESDGQNSDSVEVFNVQTLFGGGIHHVEDLTVSADVDLRYYWWWLWWRVGMVEIIGKKSRKSVFDFLTYSSKTLFYEKVVEID